MSGGRGHGGACGGVAAIAASKSGASRGHINYKSGVLAVLSHGRGHSRGVCIGSGEELGLT